MKNKGFTLIELIGTIVILSLLLLIISPLVTRSLKEGVLKVDEQAKANIELAAKNWASDNKGLLPKTQNGSYKITVSEMQEQGYLEDDIKLPSTASSINSSCVYITKENATGSAKDKYKYVYNDTEC